MALVAPASSQAELLLEATAKPAPTLVVTFARPADEARKRYPDATVVDPSPAEFAADPDEFLAELPTGGTLVVDPALGLEELATEDLRRTLDVMKQSVADAGGAGYLRCPDLPTDVAGRTRTLDRVDAVWLLDLRTTTLSIENRLYVTKGRGGEALDEPLKLKLTNRVTVDTSRDIA